MKKFKLEEHNGNYAMCCKSKEECETFLNHMNSKGKYKDWLNFVGIQMISGEGSPCYYLNREGYDRLQHALDEVDELLYFSDFVWNNEQKVKAATYEIGKKYIVTDWEENLSSEEFCNNKDNHRLLVAYIPNAIKPFICVHGRYEDEYNNNEKYSAIDWTYAKAIENPKYKPYLEVNLDWLEGGNKYSLIEKSTNKTFVIVSIVGKHELELSELLGDSTRFGFTLEELYKNFTWYDKTPFGDKINE